MGSQSRLAGFCHFYVSIQNDRKTTHLRTTSIFLFSAVITSVLKCPTSFSRCCISLFFLRIDFIKQFLLLFGVTSTSIVNTSREMLVRAA